MIVSTLTNESLELIAQQYCVDALIEDDICVDPIQVRARFQWTVESMARALRIDLRLATQVLQDDREVASFPTTLWDHISPLSA